MCRQQLTSGTGRPPVHALRPGHEARGAGAGAIGIHADRARRRCRYGRAERLHSILEYLGKVDYVPHPGMLCEQPDELPLPRYWAGLLDMHV